jgi:hypothetical protein
MCTVELCAANHLAHSVSLEPVSQALQLQAYFDFVDVVASPSTLQDAFEELVTLESPSRPISGCRIGCSVADQRSCYAPAVSIRGVISMPSYLRINIQDTDLAVGKGPKGQPAYRRGEFWSLALTLSVEGVTGVWQLVGVADWDQRHWWTDVFTGDQEVARLDPLASTNAIPNTTPKPHVPPFSSSARTAFYRYSGTAAQLASFNNALAGFWSTRPGLCMVQFPGTLLHTARHRHRNDMLDVRPRAELSETVWDPLPDFLATRSQRSEFQAASVCLLSSVFHLSFVDSIRTDMYHFDRFHCIFRPSWPI